MFLDDYTKAVADIQIIDQVTDVSDAEGLKKSRSIRAKKNLNKEYVTKDVKEKKRKANDNSDTVSLGDVSSVEENHSKDENKSQNTNTKQNVKRPKVTKSPTVNEKSARKDKEKPTESEDSSDGSLTLSPSLINKNKNKDQNILKPLATLSFKIKLLGILQTHRSH